MNIKFKGYKETIVIDLNEMGEIDNFDSLDFYVKRKFDKEKKCYLLIFNSRGVAYCTDNTSINHVSKELIEQYLQSVDELWVKYFFPFPNPLKCELLYSSDRLPSIEEIRLLPFYPYEATTSYSSLECGFCEKYEKDMCSFSRWSIVELVAKRDAISTLSYIKYAPFRIESTKIRTVIEGGKVYKIPENETSKAHVINIYNNYIRIKKKNIPVLDMILQNNVIMEEFSDGVKWDEYLVGCYLKYGQERLFIELNKMRDFFYAISYDKQFSDPFNSELIEIYPNGTKIMKIALMDGMINNIMMHCEMPYFFDQEWICTQEIPADYLVYLSLLHLSKLISEVELEKLLNRYNISEDMQRIFLMIYNDFYF